MYKLLSPGDLIADAIELQGDNRVIFRMFINTMVWGAIGSAAMLVFLT